MESQLKALMADILQLPETEITADTAAANTPAWDSIRHLSLILAVEQTFAVQFALAEIPELNDFSRLLQAIQRAGGRG